PDPPPALTHPTPLHDALPISHPCWSCTIPPPRSTPSPRKPSPEERRPCAPTAPHWSSPTVLHCWHGPTGWWSCKKGGCTRWAPTDRKSTRLNSSHVSISYAVF